MREDLTHTLLLLPQKGWPFSQNLPVPLDVFQGDEKILEVAFEEGTETYAITIEPLGGQESSNLDNLIGTISVKL